VLKLLRKRWAGAGSAPFSAPIRASGLIYAVGDVHGRHDLLIRLLDRIFEDAAGRRETPKIVFMGDYIDRGENARATIDLLISLAERTEAETVFLMGNHELTSKCCCVFCATRHPGNAGCAMAACRR
jgi:serine/threonine protein phosphatase 1